jgi:hypothetical protein
MLAILLLSSALAAEHTTLTAADAVGAAGRWQIPPA